MRKVVIVFTTSLTFLVMLSSCGKNEKAIVGKYVTDDPSEYLVLKGDGTFYLREKSKFLNMIAPETTGRYRLEGDEIVLTHPLGIVTRGRIERGMIVDPDGKSWVKAGSRREPTPGQVKPPGKKVPVTFSHGMFEVGDFSVALNSVGRAENAATLRFMIAKVKDSASEVESVPVTVTDDHKNSYEGVLAIVPEAGFTRPLPVGFDYVVESTIVMPRAAPAKTLQVGDKLAIPFEKLKLAEPRLKPDLGAVLVKVGEPTAVGKSLWFTVQGLAPDRDTWAVLLKVANADYNERKGEARCFVQFDNGAIGSPETSDVAVPGLSAKTIRLALRALGGENALHRMRLLLFYRDQDSGETALRLWLFPKNLPPRVGQGAKNEAAFLAAYDQNGGRKVMGEPVDVPRWFCKGAEPKDESDLVVQEFPGVTEFGKSAIVWDKQHAASPVYVLHGVIWEKYLQLGGPYHTSEVQAKGIPLGAPASNEVACKSRLGTDGSYQVFAGGVIFCRAGQAGVVMARNAEPKKVLQSELGFPTSDARPAAPSGATGGNPAAWVQSYEGGYVYGMNDAKQPGATIAISGAAAKVYSEMKAEACWLGFPLTEEYAGLQRGKLIDFEGGYLGTSDGKVWEARHYESGRIAFVSDRDGNQEIYVMDASGKNQVNLTNDPTADKDPAWSPDGTRIAFASNRDGNFELYTMDSSGGALRRLTFNDVADVTPAWSPDGSRIVFASVVPSGMSNKESTQVFIMNSDGSGRQVLRKGKVVERKVRRRGDAIVERHINFQGNSIEAAVAPDGRRIAFIEADTLFGTTHLSIMNLDGSDETRLSIGPYSPVSPSWSPIGNNILFARRRGDAIGLVNAQGGKPAWLATAGETPCFSPDGKKIALAYKGDIWIIEASGSLGRRLTKDAGRNTSPSWTAAMSPVEK